MFKCTVSLQKATEAISRNLAKRQVCDAMNARNVPIVTHVQNMPMGSRVLVFRPERTNKRPISLLDIKRQRLYRPATVSYRTIEVLVYHRQAFRS